MLRAPKNVRDNDYYAAHLLIFYFQENSCDATKVF